MQVLDDNAEYSDLESKYIVSLSDCRVGAKNTAHTRRDTVIFVEGVTYWGNSSKVMSHVYCNIDKRYKEVHFWVDARFRYAYKNEEKCLSYLAK